jgi:aspartyl-tRNA(Asn)/glutamyl-tRNA(Gln) amidotransferase subunit B
MERAVAYEIQRQEAVLRSGGVIEKQTLGWDENKQATFPQRSKEGSADYRYFPDPDLPSLKLSELDEFNTERLSGTIGELPGARRERYVAAGLKNDDADAFVRDPRFGDFFDAVSEGLAGESVKIAGNYIANDLVKMIRDSDTRDTETLDVLPLSTGGFRKLVAMIAAGTVTSRAAKDILSALTKSDIDPEKYATENGLVTVQDTKKLEETVFSVLDANPSVVADFKAGKAAALEFLLGQCMRSLKGSGSPEVLRDLIQKGIASR